MSVFCCDCEHLHSSAGDKLRYWICTKHMREETNFLDPKYRVWEPYEYCYKINTDGNCKDYQERKDNGI